MCGRFTLTSEDYDDVVTALEEALGVTLPNQARERLRTEHRPRYNIAPGDTSWVLAGPTPRARAMGAHWALGQARWGFSPREAGGRLLINARSETVRRRPTFAAPFDRERCLVLADGFYEWARPVRGTKRAFWIRPQTPSLMFLGGIRRRESDGTHFCILTTEASSDLEGIHDRMPVLIDAANARDWLNVGTPFDALAPLMAPSETGKLRLAPVGDRVNDPKHDDSGCIRPIEDGGSTPDLFGGDEPPPRA